MVWSSVLGTGLPAKPTGEELGVAAEKEVQKEETREDKDREEERQRKKEREGEWHRTEISVEQKGDHISPPNEAEWDFNHNINN